MATPHSTNRSERPMGRRGWRIGLPAFAAVAVMLGASGCFYRKTLNRTLDRYEKHVETFVEKMPDYNNSDQ